MTIFTDHQLEHNRPDINVVYKDTKEWTPIDITVPADQKYRLLLRRKRWKGIKT